MSAMASQITGVSIVCLIVCSGADQRKHHSSASLAFVAGIHRWPVDSPHKGPVTRKMFPFGDIIMLCFVCGTKCQATSKGGRGGRKVRLHSSGRYKWIWYYTGCLIAVYHNRCLNTLQTGTFLCALVYHSMIVGHTLVGFKSIHHPRFCKNQKILGALLLTCHDDAIKWKHFLRYWPLWAANSPVTGEFPSQRAVTRSFDVFFDLRLNKRLSNQPRHRWFETPSSSLWRHCSILSGIRTVISNYIHNFLWDVISHLCLNFNGD